jgi:hypothetical protein
LAGRTIGGADIADAALQPSRRHLYRQRRAARNAPVPHFLPPDWNGRLLYVGGGGWNGAISPLAFAPAPERTGYAIVASDSGHSASGIDASWALGNPQAQMEFAFLSVHSVAEAAKAIVADFYGNAPHHSYFEGCSNGGREGLVAASRFPSDFDGIIARAPGQLLVQPVHLVPRHGQRSSRLRPPRSAPNRRASSSRPRCGQCDALDGLADGTIADSEACTLRLEERSARPETRAVPHRRAGRDPRGPSIRAQVGRRKAALSRLGARGRRPGLAGVADRRRSGAAARGARSRCSAKASTSTGCSPIRTRTMMQVDPERHRAALALADTLLTAQPGPADVLHAVATR